jgi:hypothetical protein
MAYSAVTKPTVGDALTKSFGDGIIDNQADFQTRITSLEGSAQKIVVFDSTIYNALTASSLTGIIFFRSPSAFSLTAAVISIYDTTGSSLSGTLSFDVQKASSPDFTSSTSVFTTKPSLTSFTSYTESSNAVFKTDGTEDIAADDFLRLDIDSLPTGDVLPRIQIHVYGE